MAAHPIAFAPSEVIDPALLSGTMTARRHAPSHRSTILATVRRMIAEDGCDGIRMRRLAERSNVTPPTIYAVVGGKHDVLHAALQEGLAAKFAIAEQHAAAQDVNPIIAFAEVKWHAIATDPSYYRQIARASMGGRLDLSTVKAIHGAIADQFRRWFGMMERDGRLREQARFSLDTVAPLLASQFAVPVASWANGQMSLTRLRTDITASLALPLYGLVTAEEAERMSAWLDALGEGAA